MFDFVVQNGYELYTKIPTSDMKYVAGKLNGTLDNLSVSARAADVMGISPTSAPEIHSLSKIGNIVNEDDVICVRI